MFQNAKFNFLLTFCLLVTALAGCSVPPGEVLPTVDLQPTLQAMQVQVIGTVFAALTKNAPPATPVPSVSPSPTVKPSATNTATATPSLTPTFTPTQTWTPTVTQTASLTPTRTPIPASVTPTPGAWGCSVLDFSPERFKIFSPGTNFDGIWLVKNTGKEKWIYSDTDIRYYSGTKFQRFYDLIDLERDVASGEIFTITVEMRSPADLGTYSTTWVVARGTQVICTMSLTIIVK